MRISKLNAFLIILLLASTGVGIYLIKTYLFGKSSTSSSGDSSAAPSNAPSGAPVSVLPTPTPSFRPTSFPSVGPTISPTTTSAMPSSNPTQFPNVDPTLTPTAKPSASPTLSPTAHPSSSPTLIPTLKPSASPSSSPSLNPSASPTVGPTSFPSLSPTSAPTSVSYTSTTYVGTNLLDQTTTALTNFKKPGDIAHDSSGNKYISDSGYNIIRKISSTGTVSVLAGALGASGKIDGVGTAAKFSSPAGLAVDSNGDVFIADYSNHAIRKIDPTGKVTTPFGRLGTTGAADGTGTSARFYNPSGIAFDSSGNMLVADTYNHAIRMVTGGGTAVTTLAGSMGTSGSTDSTGTSAKFYYPAGVAADSVGNVFVADTYNRKIRQVTPGGVVSTLATLNGYYGPVDVALDTNGNVYVAANTIHNILMVTPGGVVSPIAGSSAGYTGYADGTGTVVRFNAPAGLDLDTSGNLYIADSSNNLIRKMASNGAVTTYAGIYGSTTGFADGSQASQLYVSAKGIATDTTGNLYLTSSYYVIWKVSPAGVASVLAGKQTDIGTVDGTGTDARFYDPRGLAVDPTNGNIVVADCYLHKIRKVTPGGVVTVLAGSTNGYANGIGASAAFYTPNDVAVDSNGYTYVADTNNYLVRKISPAGSVTDLAGSQGTSGSTDGAGTAAKFYNIQGITVDSAGNVYVTDVYNRNVRKITASGVVTTLAGSAADNPGYVDDIGTNARFANLIGITIDTSGNIYVADSAFYVIRKISPSLQVTTIAGGGVIGSLDSTGTNTLFISATRVCLDSMGNIYVADTDMQLIRKLQRVW